MADVVDRSLGQCVEFAREDSDAETVHLFGYSASAPIAAAYAALEPDTVRTLVLQGPPLDYDAGDGVELLRALAAELDVDRLVETMDVVPASLLEAPFALRKPIEYTVTNPLRLWDRLDDDEFVDEFARRMAWTTGGPTVPSALYRDFVEELLIENRLIRSDLRVNGRRVDLESLSVPTLLIVGRDDEFVPPEAGLPFLEAIGSDDTDAFEAPTGHVGLSVSPEAHEDLWPRVRDWLDERD